MCTFVNAGDRQERNACNGRLKTRDNRKQPAQTYEVCNNRKQDMVYDRFPSTKLGDSQHVDQVVDYVSQEYLEPPITRSQQASMAQSDEGH